MSINTLAHYFSVPNISIFCAKEVLQYMPELLILKRRLLIKILLNCNNYVYKLYLTSTLRLLACAAADTVCR